MQWVVLGTILLSIAFHRIYKTFDIPPLNLPFDPLKIVGGFPTLIEQLYEDPVNSTLLDALPSEILVFQRSKKSNLTCEVFESSNFCISLLTSSKCLPNSQFSYNFYNSTNTCFYTTSKNISSCRDPILIGNICQNIATRFVGTVAELSDVPLNSQVLQDYSNLQYPAVCKNYTINDLVRTSKAGYFEKFENSTTILDLCENFQDDLDYCNKCSENCDVPLIFLTNFDCFGGDVEISLYHVNGFLFSASFRQFPGNQTSRKKSVYFYEKNDEEEKSRFELRRGRFHCPSERTCPLELFYPLKYLKSPKFYPAQLSLLIITFLVALIIIKK